MLLFVIAFAAAQEPANTDKAKKIIGSHYEAVLIPAGSFSMGCTSEQAKCDGDEKPAHQVTLTRPYFMMTHEVTEELYKSLVKKDLVISRGAAFPAESITWFDAVRFANALSRLEKRGACYDIGDGENPKVTLKSLDCGGWRLPTEAEWEWAARGAQDAKYQYSGSDVLADVGWYVEFGRNVLIELRPVCKLQRNELGLCDMSGNTWEWVWDGYRRYTSSPSKDPKTAGGEYYDELCGPECPSYRVKRGGGWKSPASEARVSNRSAETLVIEWVYFPIGFRLVKTAK